MRPRAAILLATLVVAAGCSDDEDSADTTAAAATTSAAATTTAAATSTTAATTTTRAAATTTTEADASDTTGTRATTDASDSTDTSDSTASSGTGLDDRIDDVTQALESGDFSVMLEALNLSGLAEQIEDEEITILAPTNNAFTDLSVDEYTDLLTDASAVEALISRHIIDEVLSYEELSQRADVTMRSGDSYTVTFENDVLMIGGVTVTKPDVEALAGDQGQEIAVLAIDKVLVEASA